MRAILSREGATVLDRLAAERALIALDFDGTLATLVADRDGAHLTGCTRGLLRTLALLYPCAVVSGRARADVAARLAGIPLFAVVGCHGAEPGRGPRDRSARARVLGWKRILQGELGLVPGVDLEDKGFSIAVHYRQVPSRAAARWLLRESAPLLEGARIHAGRGVVNVAPGDGPDKGSALAEVLRRAGPRPVLYVGDDATDEAAFRAADVAVRVGRTARSAARWYVPRQREIDGLLRALVAACTRRDGLGDRSDRLARAVGD